MQVNCPRCGRRLAAADINFDALAARCADCGEAFSIERGMNDRLQAIERVLSRPAGALAIVDISKNRLAVRVPSGGGFLRALEWTAFGCFYLCIVVWWTQNALADSQNPLAWNAILILLGIALFALGLVPFATALWALCGMHVLEIDPHRARLETCCRIFRRNLYRSTREISSADVQSARLRQGVPFELAITFGRLDRDDDAPGVEIVHSRGLFVFPVATEEEGAWLARTLNEYLERNRPGHVSGESRPT
jgi:hypothetical protein